MTIEQLMKLQEEFDNEHKSKFDWNQKIDDGNIEMLEFLLISMFGEIGEAANLVKKSVRGDFPLSAIKEDLAEEITDVFIYLIKMCNQLDINLECSYLQKREKNIKRFRKYER